MAEWKVPTRALLACGVMAGPVYVGVTAAQTLTREGFDPSRHTWNVLTTGDLGWIQRSNLLIVGVLAILFAVGVRRVLGPGWVGRLVAGLFLLEGVVHNIIGAVFVSDPQPGFPPGTSLETTWQGTVHYLVRGGGFAFVIAASLVIAWWFARDDRRRGLVWLAVAIVPLGATAVFHEVLAGGLHPVLGPILFGQDVSSAPAPSAARTASLIVLTLAPTWIWATTFAVHLYGRVRRTGPDAVPDRAAQVMSG